MQKPYKDNCEQMRKPCTDNYEQMQKLYKRLRINAKTCKDKFE